MELPCLNDPACQVFYVLYGIFAIFHFWHEYLSFRQHRYQQKWTKVPNEVKDIYTQEKFSSSQVYSKDKYYFHLFQSMFSFVESTVVLLCGVMPWLWNYSGSLASSYKYNGEMWQSLTFLFFTIIYSKISSLPFSLYNTFVLEEKHGMNKQTLKFFLWDQVKAFMVSNLIGVPLMLLIIYIVQIGGPHFYLYLWAFIVSFQIFMITIYQDYIAPIFDTFIPIPEGGMKEKIFAMAKDLGFPLDRILVLEGSRRSAHSNAYFIGLFFRKTIVLYDTLLENSPFAKKKEENDANEDFEIVEREEISEEEKLKKENDEKKAEEEKKNKCTEDEVMAILCHEFGHWYYGHTYAMIAIQWAFMLINFWAFSRLYEWKLAYEAFGFATQPTLIGLLVVFSYMFTPLNELIGVLSTFLSRRNEFQADSFAKEREYSCHLIESLKKLSVGNLSFPLHDWLYSALNHSHPTLLERIVFLEEHDKSE